MLVIIQVSVTCEQARCTRKNPYERKKKNCPRHERALFILRRTLKSFRPATRFHYRVSRSEY